MKTFGQAGLLAIVGLGVALALPAAAQPTTGINVTVADWLPHWDPETGGGWGVVAAGAGPGKWRVFSSEDTAAVPPGTYDLYWIQDGDHDEDPIRMATGIVVADAAITNVQISTGISIAVADWVPALDPDYGFWGATPLDDEDAFYTNWVWGAGTAMVLPPGEYDLWWDADDADDLPPIWLEDFIVGAFGGLGIEVREGGQAIEVVAVGAGGPAGLAGVAAGDRITAVDGRSVAGLGLDAAAGMMRGPVGTSVTLTVERGAATAQSITVVRGLVAPREEIVVGAGVRAVPDPSLAPLTAGGGWWGAVFAGDLPDEAANYAFDTKAPLLLGDATYDIYWAQDANTPPRLVAANVAMVPGEIIDIPIGVAAPAQPITKAAAH